MRRSQPHCRRQRTRHRRHHLPHIFERFYRVRDGDRDADKGIGLGLAFVSWIVKAHEGRISVVSHPGQGSSFEVTLPLGR